MNLFYQFFELFLTFTEGLLVLSVSSSMSGKKYKNSKHYSLVLLFTVIYTALIAYMNTLQTFSFATITVAALYSFAVLFILSSGKLLQKAASTMLVWFFMHAIDYTVLYVLIMITGRTLVFSDGVALFLYNGWPRIIYGIIDRFVQVAVLQLLRKLSVKLKTLDNKNMFSLFLMSTVCFVLMQSLTALLFTDSAKTMQIVVVFAFIFIVLCLIAVIVAIYINSKHQKEKRESELMSLSNEMMERNFAELQNSQNAIHQQVHDFKNHIRTISGLIDSGAEAKKYIEDLLAVSYTQAQYCHSSNDVINSVINCKVIDAKAQNTSFEHRVNLSEPLYLSSVDICAILANQIDNALEACAKIQDADKRYVRVEIWQKESFVFFQVTNTANENPFNSKHKLVSTKSDKDGLHGFGIKNISRAVSAYGGILKNDYKDGEFISVAMVPNNG